VIRTNARQLFIATAMFVLAAQPALAEPDAPPPPAGPSPQPVPYPGDQQPPPPTCTNRFCIPQPGGTQGGTAAHKHIAGVKYEDFAKNANAASLELNAETVVWSADPMEGGQVSARTYHPGKPTYGNVTFDSAARTTTREPGKIEVPNMVAEPLARGTATFKTLAGLCATGKHFPKVKITTRTGGSYTLHDAIVTNVTPAGDGMDEVSLTYGGIGD
jgi:hypothetical protein